MSKCLQYIILVPYTAGLSIQNVVARKVGKKAKKFKTGFLGKPTIYIKYDTTLWCSSLAGRGRLEREREGAALGDPGQGYGAHGGWGHTEGEGDSLGTLGCNDIANVGFTAPLCNPFLTHPLDFECTI